MSYAGVLLAALIVGAAAYAAVKVVHAHFGNVDNELGLTGSLVAGAILEGNGLRDVAVRKRGEGFEARYDHRTHRIMLGKGAYSNASVAAAAVAAHECGHAIQCREHPRTMRAAELLNALSTLCSAAWPLPFAVGLLSGLDSLLVAGAALLAVAFFLQIVLLAVEADASKRGMACLDELISRRKGASKEGTNRTGYATVLSASALTYALTVPFMGLAQLMRWLWHAIVRE